MGNTLTKVTPVYNRGRTNYSIWIHHSTALSKTVLKLLWKLYENLRGKQTLYTGFRESIQDHRSREFFRVVPGQTCSSQTWVNDGMKMGVDMLCFRERKSRMDKIVQKRKRTLSESTRFILEIFSSSMFSLSLNCFLSPNLPYLLMHQAGIQGSRKSCLRT